MTARKGSRGRPSAAAKKAAVDQAVELARQIGEGQIDPRDLEAQAVEECRALFAMVDGPDDPLWEKHLEVARQVLAVGGIPAAELAEWAAVQALAEGGPVDEVLTVPEVESSASEATVVEAVDGVEDGELVTDAAVSVESAPPQRDPTLA